MVGRVIRDHIDKGAKKLTVPGFGTFMRRDGGEVIFVDLLRGDDHVLSEMVEDRFGFSEVEAMAKIDRFIFEVKTSIARHGSATIEGFGTMTIDAKGNYQFRHTPEARPVRETGVQEKLFGGDEPSPRPEARAPHFEAPSGRPEAPQRRPQVASTPPVPPPSRPAPHPQERSTPPPPAHRTPPPSPGHSSRPQHNAPPRDIPTHEPQHHPQMRKTVSPTSPARAATPVRRSIPAQKSKKGAGERKLSRIDTILIVAIAAAVLALVAMVFGLTTAGEMPFMQQR